MDYRDKLFKDFTDEYDRFNEKPTPPNRDFWRLASKFVSLGVFYFILFSALAISASHTLPLLKATIPKDFIFLGMGPEQLQYLAFVMVEGFIFVIADAVAKARQDINTKAYIGTLIVAIVVMVIANIYGVFHMWENTGADVAVGESTNDVLVWLGRITAFLLAALPAFVTLVAGSILVQREREQEAKEKEAWEKWEEKNKVYKDGLKQSWVESRHYKMTLRVEREQSRSGTLNLPSTTVNSVEDSSAQTVQNIQITFSESEQKVLNTLDTDSSASELSQAALARLVGVSVGTVNSALKKKKAKS